MIASAGFVTAGPERALKKAVKVEAVVGCGVCKRVTVSADRVL